MAGRRPGRRRRKKRSCGLSFLLAIDKPYGEVTRSVDNYVGRVLGDDGVGHIGTLDPAVTGVLVLAVGQATKLISQIEEGRTKSYTASIAFGSQTDTDDAQGDVIRTSDIPAKLYDGDYAKQVLSAFMGPGRQRPPRFSAVKVDGVRAYDLARAGKEFELPERDMYVYSAELLGIDDDEGLVWRCAFEVSPGTYIRALARDIGLEQGCAAHLGSLCRTQSGMVRLDDCVELEQVTQAGPEGILSLALDPVAVLGLPAYALSSEELALVKNGSAFAPSGSGGFAEGQRVSVVRGTRMYGVWYMEGGKLRARANCPLGIEGVRG